MHDVTLPSGLQSLTFGHTFSQNIESVKSPRGLQSLAFGSKFNQIMDNVILPSGLQNLSFGHQFQSEHAQYGSAQQLVELDLWTHCQPEH